MHRRWAFDVSPGFSVADGDERGESVQAGERVAWFFERRWTELYRANLEAGLTFRTPSRFSFRAFAGIGVLLSGSTVAYRAHGRIAHSARSVCRWSRFSRPIRRR